MEDYIFLIVAVLLSIFGAINKSKKKAGAEDQEEQLPVRNSKTDPFVDFEMTDMEDEEQEQARRVREIQARRDRKVNPFLNFEMMDVEDEEEVYAKRQKEEQERRAKEARIRQMNEAYANADRHRNRESAKDTVFHPTRFKSTLPDRTKRDIIKPLGSLEEQERAEAELQERSGYLEDFSLRKALIYSTILERKY